MGARNYQRQMLLKCLDQVRRSGDEKIRIIAQTKISEFGHIPDPDLGLRTSGSGSGSRAFGSGSGDLNPDRGCVRNNLSKQKVWNSVCFLRMLRVRIDAEISCDTRSGLGL